MIRHPSTNPHPRSFYCRLHAERSAPDCIAAISAAACTMGHSQLSVSHLKQAPVIAPSEVFTCTSDTSVPEYFHSAMLFTGEG